MKNKSPGKIIRLLILVLLIFAVLPFGLWELKKTHPILSWSRDDSNRDTRTKGLLAWPFLNLKGTPPGQSQPVPVAASENEAFLAADREKETAFRQGFFLSDGHPLSGESHSLYRVLLEEFLHVKKTGWSVLYKRDSDALLEFSNEDGRRIVLRGGIHFSGLPPSAEYKGRRALIHQRIPIYIPGDTAFISSSVDLHLTSDGESFLVREGIPLKIPLLLEQDEPLIHTGLTTVDLEHSDIDPGNYRVSGKIGYRSEVSLFRTGSEEKLYWRIIVPWIRDQIESAASKAVPESPSMTEVHSFSTRGSEFYQNTGGVSKPFFIKGINLGTALPGKWFTQFPQDELVYYNWFSRMKDLNFNTVRIYTLLPPAFYRTLGLFNERNSVDPLYLLQEIWPEEHPPQNNYLDPEYNAVYQEEIKLTIDAVHGNADIPSRSGRAWGRYRTDISPWILGFLIGREMEPDEVSQTNSLNDYSYKGRYISAEKGPSTEGWLASSCDSAVSYEIAGYGVSRPVGIVSWPTLDSMTHPLEWKDPELDGKSPYNDRAQVDIRKITMTDSSFGGFFGAYHIYPNYPDFMNNQESYSSYRDEQGSFRYGGYLKEFIQTHSGYPALVAEYGLSTSAATAHINPDGYNHGGLTETEQGEGIIRMTKAIQREGYAGAVLFEWMDEWAKKTWTTEPFMIPYDRQVLWHNVLDPEQNYGIIGMTGSSRLGETIFKQDETGESITLWGSESHLYIKMETPQSWKEGTRIYLGLDTNSLTTGLNTLPSSTPVFSPRGLESLVTIDMDSGITRFFNAGNYNFSTLQFSGSQSEAPQFKEVKVLVNRSYIDESGRAHPALISDWGELKTGPLDEPAYSLLKGEDSFTLRIPWGLMNISDPSQGRVLYDLRKFNSAPLRDEIRTMKTDGISLVCVIEDSSGRTRIIPGNSGTDGESISFAWSPWNVPAYEMKDKKSVPLLKEYLGSF
ncbi:hypothetical protein [Oceanispirochaeta sp.]|jgi:hypothetical protein|uniref:hypothetical protein n=1 Tax=Oceanispirochaeta sp. TaxID=2035350 RepID=UPI00262D6B9C|nr:hypothetical protein [Oceanispirochaeta sp.]MDA3955808.1 hypothetical protein [Oceanispirochaeta sp.]